MPPLTAELNFKSVKYNFCALASLKPITDFGYAEIPYLNFI
ncbi:hypothetical protein Epro_0801 [Endomicrobium proavitum]|uniref:Uncharacterized protein n=1 Tax=Endomicrobium proavitum TaxID=1408281 RepID=A0A0G3WJW3_9BACT|nr:hypothetical protein Epro_0801 [Endomicrobium proavitum]